MKAPRWRKRSGVAKKSAKYQAGEESLARPQ